jgi:hypothetical protein
LKIPKIPFRRLGSVLRKVLGAFALVVAIAGFVTISANPLPWLASLLPISLTTALGPIYVDQAYIQGLLTTLHTDQMVLGIALGVCTLLVLVGGVLLVQNPIHAIKGLGRGIKAAPMAFLRSPLTAYRRVAAARNWVLAKVEFLNSESAKWKTTFSILRSPYSALRAMGFSPQMALGLLFAGTTVGTGVVVNETILSERSFRNGDAGVYLAPGDVPISFVSDPQESGYNTLRIDLGATSVREITIENVSVGTVFTGSALPSGEQNVVQISGNTISGGTNTRILIGHLIFEKSRCKKLTLTDIQAHTLIVRGNASDGQSLAPSAGTSRMLGIGGGNSQADSMVHSGGTFDRILIQAPTSGVNGKIGTLRLSNLYTKGGECVLSKLTVGTIEILLNEVGMGNGFATKEFVISTNVTAANITLEDNVEVTIAEPATQ